MKGTTFITGIAAGMVVAAAAIGTMYPDITRRMVRDGKKMFRGGRRSARRISDML